MLEVENANSSTEAQIVIGGTEIQPKSTYRLTLSNPSRTLEQGTTDSGGSFWKSRGFPQGLAAGTYLLTLTATAADGSTLVLYKSFSILSSGGLIVNPTMDDSLVLARTGAGSLDVPIWLSVSSLLLLMGSMLIASGKKPISGTRRRSYSP